MAEYFRCVPAVPVQYEDSSFSYWLSPPYYTPLQNLNQQELFDLFWKPCMVQLNFLISDLDEDVDDELNTSTNFYSIRKIYKNQFGQVSSSVISLTDSSKPELLLTNGLALTRREPIEFSEQALKDLPYNDVGVSFFEKAGASAGRGELYTIEDTDFFTGSFGWSFLPFSSLNVNYGPLVSVKNPPIGDITTAAYTPLYYGDSNRVFEKTEYQEFTVNSYKYVSVQTSFNSSYGWPKVGEFTMFGRIIDIYGTAFKSTSNIPPNEDGTDWDYENEEYSEEKPSFKAEGSLSIATEFQMTK